MTMITNSSSVPLRMNRMNNPLLDQTGLPRFAEIRPEHVAPAIDQLLAENRALIARQLSDGVGIL
jgi:oligopeptidase A (EC:3.4.24.70). Metallo peptidase. MEROPS family M03A